jgi:hypothetical protein
LFFAASRYYRGPFKNSLRTSSFSVANANPIPPIGADW